MSDMPDVFPTDEPTAGCQRTMAVVRAVFDGERPAADLDADAHPIACAECRGRVAEARVLLAALALPSEPVAVPTGFAAGVLSAVRADRRARNRRRLLASVGGGLAVAAALLVGVWVMNGPADRQIVVEATRPAPEQRPVRVSAEFAKAGDALRESSRPITEPAVAAPKVFASLAEVMLPPLPAPMGDTASPAAVALAELPSAARTGLEPVTGTTQKAFTRLLRDVNVLQPAARPKS